MSSVTELLHTKYPLVQAPMNWATDARFVAAVAN
ncbi:nitronate monooxygenase, partial [Limosilactobacillus fermentum]|nr:nitronate monooxygenase [Limosilactobacillus fermentum]